MPEEGGLMEELSISMRGFMNRNILFLVMFTASIK
jgi:hypothetical protein